MPITKLSTFAHFPRLDLRIMALAFRRQVSIKRFSSRSTFAIGRVEWTPLSTGRKLHRNVIIRRLISASIRPVPLATLNANRVNIQNVRMIAFAGQTFIASPNTILLSRTSHIHENYLLFLEKKITT